MGDKSPLRQPWVLKQASWLADALDRCRAGVLCSGTSGFLQDALGWAGGGSSALGFFAGIANQETNGSRHPASHEMGTALRQVQPG